MLRNSKANGATVGSSLERAVCKSMFSCTYSFEDVTVTPGDGLPALRTSRPCELGYLPTVLALTVV